MEPKIVGEMADEEVEAMREMLFECALNPAMCTPETQEQRKKRIMRTVVGVGLLGAVAASAVILFRDRFKWK
ncbi:uncharacterized protein [Blastocystis hominis]|uniref:Transmembrane protein n=1 Tax=Blastocystis hominis TaxID=12968 RepID=D8M2J6_BLAHO|nr:uncharacterized protein [Blastocystis hominis]CBK22285.2 unnamed protein product [Blastocystis hominis]|eukprot:XP_012896333.1 uncharacterized protein [Blastocystis hominis]